MFPQILAAVATDLRQSFPPRRSVYLLHRGRFEGFGVLNTQPAFDAAESFLQLGIAAIMVVMMRVRVRFAKQTQRGTTGSERSKQRA